MAHAQGAKGSASAAEARPLQIEANGINVISDAERKGKPHDLFWPWFAANVSVRTHPMRQDLIGAYQVCEVTLHDRQRVCMQVLLRRRSVDAVLRDNCVVIPVKHLPNRQLHRDVRFASGKNDGPNAVAAQQHLELRIRKCARAVTQNYLLAAAQWNFGRQHARCRLVCLRHRPTVKNQASALPRMVSHAAGFAHQCWPATQRNSGPSPATALCAPGLSFLRWSSTLVAPGGPDASCAGRFLASSRQP